MKKKANVPTIFENAPKINIYFNRRFVEFYKYHIGVKVPSATC